ncbi:hypothetical protein BpHYR1_023296 [Brachionus plicatilis]|uniref:Uncharacterized protein n=1 Tax=Brachionus plicatilis TaxID=10195 RepID=A0A3M7QRX6_BRAPC|nr:hypothetical protein BpHYR1_023296 [Brachionus plicatilis]
MSSFIFSTLVLPTTMLIVISAVLIFELDVFLEIIELVHPLSIANLTGLPSTRPFILSKLPVVQTYTYSVSRLRLFDSGSSVSSANGY